MSTRADAHDDEFHKDQSWKFPCLVATTANITLSGEQTIDGVLTSASRVLVKDQGTGSQNGIYKSAAGVWARAYDMDTGLETVGSLVKVVSGTVNGNQVWMNTNTGTVTIGTTALTFAQLAPTSGTVTSVALTVPAEFSVSGSPITSSGTLAVTKANETANTLWAGPASGTAAAPTFRALVAADIPAGIVPTDHEHINDVQFSGDGATTAFELPAAPFDAYAVMAYVAGVRQDVVLSGTLLTTMTFSSAPASGTNNIIVDIVAIVA